MNNMDSIKRAFPALETNETLRADVERATRLLVLEQSRKKRTRRAITTAVATSALVVGASLTGPKAYAIYRLKQIAASVGDVESAILESYRITDRGPKLAGRTTYSHGMWRIEHGDEVQVYSAGKLQIFDPANKRVTIMQKPDGPFGYNPSGFSISSMLSDMTRWQWRQSIQVGSSTFNGKKVDVLTITDDSERERTIVYADSKSHFPIEYRNEASSATGWRLRGITRPVFNIAVAPSTFELHVPAGTKFVDQAAAAVKWQTSLEKPIATMSYGKTDIQVRQVTVNSRGHVFIIYTNGETKADREAYGRAVRARETDQAMAKWQTFLRPDWEVETPTHGKLVPSIESFQPYVGGPHHDVVLSDGQVLQGAWLIPTKDSTWVPGDVKIRAAAFIEGKSVHGMTLPLREKPDILVPDWMSLIAIGPQERRDIFRAERRVQTEALKALGNWPKVAQNLRADLEDIREQEAKGQSYAKGTLYYELYDALRKSGNRQEAIEFLRLASKEPLYPNQYPADAIAAAVRREGL